MVVVNKKNQYKNFLKYNLIYFYFKYTIKLKNNITL